MATKQSPLLANAPTVTNVGTPNNVANEHGRVRSANGNIVLATGDLDAADIIMLCGVPTGAVVLSILIAHDDLDSNATETLNFDVGIYKSATDTAENGDEDVYANATNEDNASSFGIKGATEGSVNYAFEARGIQLNGQKVFEDAGDSVDPNSVYYIGISIETVAATKVAGDLAFQVTYAVD